MYSSPYLWRIASVSALIFAVSMTMVGFWADQWFVYVPYLSASYSAHHLFVMTLLLIAGILFNGLIADILTSYFKLPITVPISIGFALFIIVEPLLIYTPYSDSYLIWGLFGFLGRNITLSYVAISGHFPLRYTARAVTALNLVFFMKLLLCK
jgi:hypothetical protein